MSRSAWGWALRVAFFTESLPPLTDGVARTYTWLARALDAKGVDFRFYSPCLPLEREPWRGRVVPQPSLPFPLYRYYRVALPFPWALAGDLDSFRPDLIQVATPTPMSYLARLYARRRGIPVVSSYHTHFADYLPYYGLGPLVRAAWSVLRRFHNAGMRTYAPSPSCLRRLDALGFRRLELWGRGVDLGGLSPRLRSGAERRRWAPEGGLLCLFVGRLVADKDLRVLAAALEQARASGVKLRCVFAGDGPLRRELKARLPRDHFPGFVRGKDLARLYASSDLFVFPSPNETFGNVVLEAMASGIPVLAAAAGGSLDLVEHDQSGLLVQPGDAGAFARAIAWFSRRPRTRRAWGRRGRALARRHHWRSVHARQIASYERILREPPYASGPASGPASSEAITAR